MDQYLTKDKVSVIIQNAPAGTKPEDVINGLVSRGYKLEGFNDTPETKTPNSNILDKTTNVITKVFPGKQVGEAIGTLAGYGITAGKEKLGLAPKGATEAYDLSAPTPLQVAGDVAQGALTIGGIKAPMPATTVARLGQTTVFGAGLSGSEAVSQGKSIKNVAKDTVTGALTGAVTQGAFEALPVLGKWLGKKANNLRTENLKLTPTDKLKLNNKIGEVVDYLKKENITGGPAKQYTEITKRYNTTEDILQETLKQSGKTYTRQEIIDDVLNIPEKYSGQIDNPDVYQQLVNKSKGLADYIDNQIGKKYGDAIPVEKLNDLKRQYMKNAFNKGGDAVTNEANMAIGDELYNKILKDVDTIKPINDTYSTVITAKKILGKALGRNQLSFTGNLIATGAGAGLGGAVGGPVGGVVGAVIGKPLATKVAGTAARTQYAKGAETIAKSLANKAKSKIPTVITKLAD